MKISKKWLYISGAAVLSVVLWGCGSNTSASSGSVGDSQQTPVNTQEVKATESNSTVDQPESQSDSQQTPANAQEVKATESNWKIELEPAVVKAGQPVKFSVISKEGVHGFKIVGTDVNQTIVPGAPPVEVVYTFSKPGNYTIRCSVPCGSGHSGQKTIIKVS